VTDLYLGILVASTVALALLATVALSLLTWLIRWVSKFAHVELRKDKAGAVVISAEVRK
jgi:hypothetical protein